MKIGLWMWAVARTVLAVIVVVVMVIAAAAIYFMVSTSPSSTSTTSLSSTMSTAPLSYSTSSAARILVADYEANPPGLDPRVTPEISAWGVLHNIYQPLVYFDNANTSVIVPVLASSYTESPDGSTFTFTIRPDVRFSNGDPLNAYCVWYTWYSAAIMGQPNSLGYVQFLNMSGVTAADLNGHFQNSMNVPDPTTQALASHTVGVTVIDSMTVRFHLVKPAPDFLPFLTQDDVVDPHYVDTHGGVTPGQSNTYMNLNPMGTGPFVMREWVQNDHITLVRNPTYFGGVTYQGTKIFPTPYLDEVIIRFVPDVTTRLTDLQSGAAQVAVTDWEHLGTGIPGVGLPNVGLSVTMVMIALNTAKAPTNNLLVREAIAHAINYTEIDQTVYHGYIKPTIGPVSLGVFGHDPNLKQYSYNTTLSAQLLTQAGYPKGSGLQPVSFVYATDYPESQMIGQIIQSNLAQVGIKVNLVGVPFSSELALWAQPVNSTQEPNMGWVSCTWVPVPTACPSYFYPSSAPINWPHFNNSEVDRLWNDAKYQQNATIRAQDYYEIAEITYDNVWWIWLGQPIDMLPSSPMLISNSVRGIYYDPVFANIDFSTVTLSP
jgi:peptide/nickel transport system substrate-binding protein